MQKLKNKIGILPFLYLILIVLFTKADASMLFKVGIAKNTLLYGYIVLLLLLIVIRFKKWTITPSLLLFGSILMYFLIQNVAIGGFSIISPIYASLLTMVLHVLFVQLYRETFQKYFPGFILIIVFIIAVQSLLITRVVDDIVFTHYGRKNMYLIPIGGSNYIAAILTLLTIVMFYLRKKYLKTHFYVTLLLSGLAIIALRSRSALIVCVVVFASWLFHIVSKKFNVSKQTIRYIITFLILIVIGSMSAYLIFKYLSLNGNYQNHSNFLDAISSGRYTLYIENIQNIFVSIKYFLFGYGFQYGELTQILPHDIFQTIVLYGGIIGLQVMLVIGYLILQRSKNNPHATLTRIVLIVVVLQGLFEPTLFSQFYDIFFYLSLLFALSYVNEPNVNFKLCWRWNVKYILIWLSLVCTATIYLHFYPKYYPVTLVFSYQVEAKVKDQLQPVLKDYPEVVIDDTLYTLANRNGANAVNEMIHHRIVQDQKIKKYADKGVHIFRVQQQQMEIRQVQKESMILYLNSVDDNDHYQLSEMVKMKNSLTILFEENQQYTIGNETFRIVNLDFSSVKVDNEAETKLRFALRVISIVLFASVITLGVWLVKCYQKGGKHV